MFFVGVAIANNKVLQFTNDVVRRASVKIPVSIYVIGVGSVGKTVMSTTIAPTAVIAATCWMANFVVVAFVILLFASPCTVPFLLAYLAAFTVTAITILPARCTTIG